MIISPDSNGPQSFPAQRKTDAQKSKKWLKDCVNAGVELVNWESGSGLRKNKVEMQRLYNIVNGIIDPSDKKNIGYFPLPMFHCRSK